RLPQVPLGLADELVVEAAGVELDQRELPGARDVLRRERLPAALHADQQDTAGRGQVELRRARGTGQLRAVEPAAQAGEAAELGRVVGGREVLEQALFLQDAGLELDDAGDVRALQDAVLDRHPRDRLPRLV